MINEKWIRSRRADLLANTSDAEKIAYALLRRMGYNVVRQKPIYTGRKIYFADLYIPKIRTIIEIDGGYHYTKRQKRLDTNRSQGLWRLGYHVVRLSNRDARDARKIKAKLSIIVK